MKLSILGLLTLLTACDLTVATVEQEATYASSAVGGGTTGTGDRKVTITPAVGDLLVACASLSGNTQPAPGLTDNQGGTYALVAQVAWAADLNNAVCFVRNMPVSVAVATTLTLDTDVNTAGEIAVVTFAGLQRSGADAVRQVAVTANGAAATTPSTTFAMDALTTNPTVAVVASGDTTTAPPSGWTERRDATQWTPTTAIEVATRNNGFIGTTITNGAAQSTSYAAIRIELDASTPPTDGDAATIDAAIDAPPSTGCTGAHGIVYMLYGHAIPPAQVTIDPAPGSTLIVSMGGLSSDIDNGPTDGVNTYSLVGNVIDYADWAGYGTAVWKTVNVSGDPVTISQDVTLWNEITMMVIEVPNAGAAPVITESFHQVPNSGATSPLTSASLTTTGPATRIALWAGAGPPNNGNHVATPNNGYGLGDGYGTDHPDGYVQMWSACKVDDVGLTQDVTWAFTPNQGAQLRVIAVQP